MIESDEWKLFYYRTLGLQTPFREWQESLPDFRAAASVSRRLERFRSGLFGDCEPVGEGVFEFKIDLGPGYRG